MTNYFLINLMFFIVGHIGLTTEQMPDVLMYQDKSIRLKYFPLESLKMPKRPFGLTRATAPHTACWRGYVGEWRVVNDKLYLKKLIHCDEEASVKEQDLKSLFDANNIEFVEYDGMIWANWVTTDLYITHFGYYEVLYDGYDKEKYDEGKNLKLSIVEGDVLLNKL